VEFFGTQGSIFWEKCQNSMALDVVTQQVHDFKVQKFVMGMFGNQVSNSYTRANLKLLCMTLRHFWPSHAFYYCSNVCFQSLCKFAQSRVIFIFDFVLSKFAKIECSNCFVIMWASMSLSNFLL
jgi:hypothetical protein